jgi:MFS superfamily sulfate permease-like transporter
LLAAVVIAAAISLADFSVLARVWTFRRSAVVLSLVASAGVIFLGVLEGIVVAVELSVVLFFQRNWWPHGEILGRVPDREGWHSDPERHGFTEHPNVLVFRWEAPLFFANAGIFADRVRELVRERRPAWVVLQCEAITDIDVTAAGMLERVDNELNAKGVHLAFVELRTRLRDLVHDYGLLNTLDGDHFYATVDDALAQIEPTLPTTRSES